MKILHSVHMFAASHITRCLEGLSNWIPSWSNVYLRLVMLRASVGRTQATSRYYQPGHSKAQGEYGSTPRFADVTPRRMALEPSTKL